MRHYTVESSAKEGQQQWRQVREGAYLLRMNLTAATAFELWDKYMQLTEVEAAFRAAVSLQKRPQRATTNQKPWI